MKRANRNLGRLGVSAVGGGLLCAGPAAPPVDAAPVGTNLVVNGGFESVDTATIGGYDAVRILDWSGAAGFAYNYGQNYDNGGPLAGGGTYYFTPNASDPELTEPGQFFQDINVSTGPSATVIAAAQGRYNLSAFMSGYAADGDFGNVHAEFRDGAGASLGFTLISDADPSTWTLNSRGGHIPVGTQTVRLSLYGTPITSGPDGYIDNVMFRVVEGTRIGDFDVDGDTDAADIDLLFTAINNGEPKDPYDVNSDNVVDMNDLTFEVTNIIGTEFGDTDTDHDVDLADLGNLASGFGQPGASWMRGDFDGDGDVDLNNLGTLATNFDAGRDQAFAHAQALGVPEPSAAMLVLSAAAGVGLLRRKPQR